MINNFSTRLPERFYLEEWFREHYFNSPIVLCSSGVQPFLFRQLLTFAEIPVETLYDISLDDAPTQGALGLRRAIANRFSNGDPATVIPTHGSSEAIYLAMSLILSPGDEFITLDPAYQLLKVPPVSTGAIVRHWKLDGDREFVPELEKLIALINHKTKLIVLNFPHNPTGAVLGDNGLTEVIEVCKKHNLWLLWDAAFDALRWDGSGPQNPFGAWEKVLVCGTLSKSYGLPGLRIGWLIGNPVLIEKCTRLRDYSTLNLSPLTEYLGEQVIKKIDNFFNLRRSQAEANLKELVSWAERNLPKGDWCLPKGGVSFFPKLRGRDTRRFCKDLIKNDGVMLLPGDVFFDSERVRLGFGGCSDSFSRGLSSITAALKG